MTHWTKKPDWEADGSIAAEARIEPDDAWFDGHFPGQPLLPAVAQLSLAVEAIRIAAEPEAEAAGFFRVKFREMIRPGEPVTVFAEKKEGSAVGYAFRLSCDGKTACTGSVVFRPRKDRQRPSSP